MNMNFFVLSSLISSLMISLSFASRGPPDITSLDREKNLAVKVGSTLRVSCPVTGNPTPFVGWQKDGKSLPRGWERFRQLDHGLRIKDVKIEDSGVYTCKAANGFGSVEASFFVLVYGDGEFLEAPTQDDFNEKFSLSKNIKVLQTSPPSALVKNETLILAHSGDNVKIQCDLGSNEPIIWYKDGVLHQDNDIVIYDKQFLMLEDVSPEDSGTYKCTTTFGSENNSRIYILIVGDITNAKKGSTMPPSQPSGEVMRPDSTASSSVFDSRRPVIVILVSCVLLTVALIATTCLCQRFKENKKTKEKKSIILPTCSLASTPSVISPLMAEKSLPTIQLQPSYQPPYFTYFRSDSSEGCGQLPLGSVIFYPNSQSRLNVDSLNDCKLYGEENAFIPA